MGESAHSILDLFGIGLTTIGLTDSESRIIGLTILSIGMTRSNLPFERDDNNRADGDGISNDRADITSVSPLIGLTRILCCITFIQISYFCFVILHSLRNRNSFLLKSETSFFFVEKLGMKKFPPLGGRTFWTGINKNQSFLLHFVVL